MVERIENVIFLGAGASKAEGASTQNNLIQSFFANQDQFDRNLVKRCSRLFKDLFGINSDEHATTVFPTFEEILGMFDIALSRYESFKGFGIAANGPKAQQSRDDMIFLIANVLQHELQGTSTCHRQLVRGLLNGNILKKTAFFSSNYDILVDNALTELHDHDNIDLDYGVDFTNYEKQNDWHRPDPDKAVNLLKLHGSLNWLYCPTCISLTLTPKIKSVATLITKPKECETCKSEMIPIIIPPTFFKVMSNFYLQQIWRKSETILTQAKTLIFCGYSFPDADIHLKYLMKRAELNSTRNLCVYVINNGMNDDEKKRFQRFFSKETHLRFTGRSFQEFAESGFEIFDI